MPVFLDPRSLFEVYGTGRLLRHLRSFSALFFVRIIDDSGSHPRFPASQDPIISEGLEVVAPVQGANRMIMEKQMKGLVNLFP